ncbi:uncharacterized protein N7483_002899 [Penicillium malachiteum]|uniref:uncharacterized protein n=1 Tax=Penicillium malachiteum TaxID=1324776 RepID=UPI00254902CA|nr:uncharacterized protein N7483_002899 [Penicillium malachiteum]KAJ5737774.1 hypothetical protein N7483_002899 [Penicillium malachiteum]
MRLPLEILVLILREAVEIISLKDLIKARLVSRLTKESGFFADEILLLLTKDITRLENEILGFKCASYRRAVGHDSKWWEQLPLDFKRNYLHQKLQLHTESPCEFSYHIHEILDVPHERTTSEETEIIVDKVIDAFLCATISDVRELFDPKRLYPDKIRYYTQTSWSTMPCTWEPAEKTLKMALATSAIIRGDASELELVHAQGDLELNTYSTRLCFHPVGAAARRGNEHIIKVLTDNSWGLNKEHIINASRNSSSANAASIAARHGNLEPMKYWLKPENMEDYQMPEYVHLFLKRAIRGAIEAGNIGYVIYLLGVRDSVQVESPGPLFDFFIDAIKAGHPTIVKYFLDLKCFDINTHTSYCRKGSLLTALQDTRPDKRLPVLNLLLEYDAHPDGIPESFLISRTPFQAAIKCGDTESAALLVKFGADIHATTISSPRGKSKPLLLQAIQQKSAHMIEFLLAQGIARECDWKKKRYIVHNRAQQKELRNVLLRLGGTNDLEDAESHIRYCVTVERIRRIPDSK